MNKSQALAIIQQDFIKDDLMKHAGERILQRICEEKDKDNLNHLSLRDIANISQVTNEKQALILIKYFLGCRVNLLKINYLFFDGEEFYPLDANMIKDAEQNNAFYHPDNGEEVINYATHIYISYSLSEIGKHIQ